jgi:predicted transcriptional regulator
MASIRDELDSFHRFATERLASGELAVTLDQLFMEWQDSQLREEISEAIRRGLNDVDMGRHRPVDEAMEAIRQRLGIRDESE